MYYHLENKMTEANEQLGDFLRSRRERLTPERLGLQVLRRRRTPGLRREEVASAAGISGEWYVKLEQGRAVAPSPATIDALAKALLLDDVDHAHLKSLARPSHRRSFVRETVPDPVKRLVNSLEHPAYVTGQRWDVLAWNKAASSMLANFEELAMEDRNILLYVLTDPRAKTLFGERWDAEAMRMVALFRSTYDLWAEDPAFTDLISRLRLGCSRFDAWWSTHEIGSAVSGTKTVHHPTRGPLRYEYVTFQANDDPRLKLAAFIPC
ncbi:MAG: helix-turn-helix transcriptional regulator [Terriglobales bacterium]